MHTLSTTIRLTLAGSALTIALLAGFVGATMASQHPVPTYLPVATTAPTTTVPALTCADLPDAIGAEEGESAAEIRLGGGGTATARSLTLRAQWEACRAAPTISEGESGWDCNRMGNGLCSRDDRTPYQP